MIFFLFFAFSLTIRHLALLMNPIFETHKMKLSTKCSERIETYAHIHTHHTHDRYSHAYRMFWWQKRWRILRVRLSEQHIERRKEKKICLLRVTNRSALLLYKWLLLLLLFLLLLAHWVHFLTLMQPNAYKMQPYSHVTNWDPYYSGSGTLSL